MYTIQQQPQFYPQQQQQPQIIGALTTHGGYHPYIAGQSGSGFLSQAVPFQGGATVVRSGVPVAAGGAGGLAAQPSYLGQQQQQPGVPVLSTAPLAYGSYAAGGAAPYGSYAGGGFGGGYGSYAGGAIQGGYGGGYGGGFPGSYGGQGSYGHPGQQVRAPEAPNYNRGYFYDDYIHDRHSPRRSYAAFRDARQPVAEGDVIYRHTIRRDDDFVLPRRSPRSEALEQQRQQQQQQRNVSAPAPQQQQQQQTQQQTQQQPPAQPTQQPSGGPATIEVVEAKDLPTSILDKTDPYVRITIGGKQFSTTHKDDAGKAARWNESFTIDNVRTGVEGSIEIRDKDTLKDDAIASSNFFLENGDRWFTLKPKGQVRLNVRGVNN